MTLQFAVYKHPTDGSAEITVQGAIVPDDCWGEFPSSNFDIGCDEGAWNHIGRKVYCTFTDLAYQGSRSATATALWMVEWAYAFGVYERLGGPAITIAESYEANMIGPLGLAELAWFYAIAWAGLNILRGKLTLAGGELAASVVMAALAAILLANPAGYLNGAFGELDPYTASMLYAYNRKEECGEMAKDLAGDVVYVLNRYVGSNIGHQGGKLADPAQRKAFIAWLLDLDPGILEPVSHGIGAGPVLGGASLVALRSGAPVIPCVIVGSEDLPLNGSKQRTFFPPSFFA